ncbi:uncharacterized protein FOBCDRAFT_286868 [Fusarium oxysporum Fo47]|nr:uncharacterized protein FOBCDRAFT_286868 [Fusarium oxysporum Fo47]QKD62525.2 hypothetical protein FOBCDRAFT_286868 [Fusarium oxysporum Fo47]
MAGVAQPHAQQQEDQSLSIPEEMSPAFCYFKRLPIELRLKIWEAACLPSTDADHGLHYVTLDVVEEGKEGVEDMDDEEYLENLVIFDADLEGYDEEFEVESDDTGYVTLRALKRPCEKSSETTNPNKSAYLWDAGLCKDFPSTIVPFKKNEKWLPVVRPTHDIFCIDTTKLKSLSRSLFGMKLLAPFLGTRTFTIKERWNIAFKFDHSWNNVFPSRENRLKRENSPRGLLAHWVEILSEESVPAPNLWIIDDDVRWVARPGQVFETVYRDCEADYVQINWEATRDNKISLLKGAVARFMDSFGLVCDNEDMYDLQELGLEPMAFRVKDHIKLLVRKDNEMQDYMEEDNETDNETEDDTEIEFEYESDDLSGGSDGSDQEGE